MGNSPLFWKEDNCGYTQWIDEAKYFTSEEADKIIENCKGSHEFKKVLVSSVDKIAKRTIDIQDLK